MARHAEMSSWFKFCKEKVDKIEKVWNKKLEEESTNSNEPSEDEKEEEQRKNEEYEKSLQEMFENFGKRNLSKSF